MERIRGSIDVPATPEGLMPVAAKSRALERANPGRGFLVISSRMRRAKQTADVLLSGPTAHPVSDAGLADPRAYGGLEGKELTPEVSKELERLASNPKLVPKGRHALSTRPGESASEFGDRAKKLITTAMNVARQHPKVVPVVVTFNSMIKAVQWALESGDLKKLNKYLGQGGYGPGAGSPASIHVVDGAAAKPRFHADWNPEKKLPPLAVVLMRHGMTAFNKEHRAGGPVTS